MSTFNPKKLAIVATAAAGLSLTLSACGEEPEFDTMVPDAYIECLETSPAVEADEISLEVEESADRIILNAEISADGFHFSTGSHSDHMFQCQEGSHIATTSDNRESSSEQLSNGDVAHRQAYRMADFTAEDDENNHEVYMSVYEVEKTDGTIQSEVNFQPIQVAGD